MDLEIWHGVIALDPSEHSSVVAGQACDDATALLEELDQREAYIERTGDTP